MKVLDAYNLFVGGAMTILAGIFGEFYYIFVAFLLLNVVDYLTGWAKSKVSKSESSMAGLKGIMKKIGYWITISIAFLIPATLTELLSDTLQINADFLMYFGWFTVACFLINEARSIIENLIQIGVEVPGFLVKGLAVADQLITERAEAGIPDIGDEEKGQEEHGEV